MKHKEILVFGATGQIGRNLIRKLTENNYKIIAVTRNIHIKGYILKTQANPGYLELVEVKNFEEKKLQDLFERCSICINLIGILFEKKKYQFDTIHHLLPQMLSKLAHKNKIEKFIHFSALNVENINDSDYATSKSNGEKKVLENFSNSTIIKPSLVYSIDDNFTTTFMSLLSKLPIMPLYYNGKTRFQPIHVSDLVNVIIELLKQKKNIKFIECLGPDKLTFKEILLLLLKAIDKKRLLIPMPLRIAKISAKFLQLFPTPLLTEDQLKLLKYDNIQTGKHMTNYDLGIKANKKFENVIFEYSYNWMNGGKYNKINKQIL